VRQELRIWIEFRTQKVFEMICSVLWKRFQLICGRLLQATHTLPCVSAYLHSFNFASLTYIRSRGFLLLYKGHSHPSQTHWSIIRKLIREVPSYAMLYTEYAVVCNLQCAWKLWSGYSMTIRYKHRLFPSRMRHIWEGSPENTGHVYDSWCMVSKVTGKKAIETCAREVILGPNQGRGKGSSAQIIRIERLTTCTVFRLHSVRIW
jgi:hypothetical protein